MTGVMLLRDLSHPRGGILVATRQAANEIKDLPPDTLIVGDVGGPHPLQQAQPTQPMSELDVQYWENAIAALAGGNGMTNPFDFSNQPWANLAS